MAAKGIETAPAEIVRSASLALRWRNRTLAAIDAQDWAAAHDASEQCARHSAMTTMIAARIGGSPLIRSIDGKAARACGEALANLERAKIAHIRGD